jgi:GrpB protein
MGLGTRVSWGFVDRFRGRGWHFHESEPALELTWFISQSAWSVTKLRSCLRVMLTVGSVLGSLALRIEHVGSTSVPGLAAKPIVDLSAGGR